MFKNLKMRLSLTLVILLLTICCICMLFFSAKSGMTELMEKSALINMRAELKAQTTLIEEYLAHQEDLLKEYSINPLIKEYLNDLTSSTKQKSVQEYTEIYYQGLDNWEGLYVAEWDTHVGAHSNPAVVGITTREGDGLKGTAEINGKCQRLIQCRYYCFPGITKVDLIHVLSCV